MMKLLVVDGRHARRQGIVQALGRIIGISVQGAIPSYWAAKQILASYTPDIVIAGTDLGDGTALDLLADLANLARRPRIVVIGELHEAACHLEAGADRFSALGAAFDLPDIVIALAREFRQSVA
jgi:DNA-binding NarL/FixJ family response regulator